MNGSWIRSLSRDAPPERGQPQLLLVRWYAEQRAGQVPGCCSTVASLLVQALVAAAQNWEGSTIYTSASTVEDAVTTTPLIIARHGSPLNNC